MIYLVNFRDSGKHTIVTSDGIEKVRNEHKFSSISRGYESFEDMSKGEKFTGKPCNICGDEHFPTKYTNGDILRDKNICFSCNYWEEQDFMRGKKRIIVNGIKYADGGVVNKINVGFSGLGHGGRTFHIRFKESGEVFKTNNLWCQGDISEAFKERMPDNAEFLTKEEFEQLIKE